MYKVVSKIVSEGKTVGYIIYVPRMTNSHEITTEQAYKLAVAGLLENCTGVNNKGNLHIRGKSGFDLDLIHIVDREKPGAEIGGLLEVLAQKMVGKQGNMVCAGYLIRNHSAEDITLSNGTILKARMDNSMTREDIYYLCQNSRIGKVVKNAKLIKGTPEESIGNTEEEAWLLVPYNGITAFTEVRGSK